MPGRSGVTCTHSSLGHFLCSWSTGSCHSAGLHVTDEQGGSFFKLRLLERERLSALGLPEMSVRNWGLDIPPTGWAPDSDMLPSCFLSDCPIAPPEWPGPLPHRLFLAGVFRICHCHWHHTVQQMAGTEPEAFLLSYPTTAVSAAVTVSQRWPECRASWVFSSLQQLVRDSVLSLEL